MARPKNISNLYDPPKSNTQFVEGHKSKGLLEESQESKSLQTQTIESNKLTVNGGATFLSTSADPIRLGVETDDTTKLSYIISNQYDTSGEPEGFLMVGGVSTSAVSNKVFIGGGSSDYNAANEIEFYTFSDTTTHTGNRAMTIDSSQNVGIGTTSPVAKLTIVPEDGNDDNAIHITNHLDSSQRVQLGVDSNFGVVRLQDNTGNDKINIIASGNTYFNGGNVGIGTTSPGSPLTIKGVSNAAAIKTLASDNGRSVEIGTWTADNGVIRIFHNDGSENVRLRTDGDSYFTGGDVGIGTDNPVTKTEIADGTSAVLTLHNTEHTDVEGDRLGGISFRGEQSGGEIHVLSKVEVVHDGGADDQKGRLDWYVNDGDDGTTPSLRFSQIFSDGKHIHKDSTGDTVTFFDGTYGLNVDTSGGEGASARFYDNNSTVIICDGGNEALEAGGATDKIFVDNDGNIFWGGSGNGLHFCSCYGNEIGWTQVAAQNTWYDISDADITTGQSNVISHSQGQFTVSKNGMYEVHYDISVQSSVANKHIQATFSVNGTEGNDGMNHIEAPSANKSFAVGGCAILALSANDTVNCSIRTTDAGNPTLEVDHYNITIKLIGGNDPAP